MYLTKVAPLSRIPRPSPQFLSYFTIHKLERGALVNIPLRKKKVKAVVFSQTKASNRKMEIKKASFELKPISKIVEKKPVLSEKQIELAKWIADYYWTPFGKVLSAFLRNSKKSEITFSPKSKRPSLKTEIKIVSFEYRPEIEIKESLEKGNEILFLVPEKTKEKFWKEKLKNYNSPNLIIGTRANLFRPFKNLGLIVLTEEGSQNYKSQMEPKYNAKEVAEKLSEIWGAKLIITSSFPSVETYYRIENKKEGRKNEILKKMIIDMKKVKPWKPLSEELNHEIKKTISEKGRVLLFINRRGTATTLLCQDCGWIQKCENCDVPLTYYLKRTAGQIMPQMICHYCGTSYKASRLCKKCKSWNLNTLGVGTEKIEEELAKKFGREKMLRLDSEITETEKDQKEVLKSFLGKDVPLLLTTSIIFKYFPIKKISLVGIVSLDALLFQPDFKIEEECARIIDRLLSISDKKFILQTFFPNSKATSWAKENKEMFFKKAIAERKKLNYPPFSSLIKLSFSNRNQVKARTEASNLKRKLKEISLRHNIKNIEIIGPSPAFIEKIKGEYAWKLLIKLKNENKQFKNFLLSQVPPNCKIDIDPIRII